MRDKRGTSAAQQASNATILTKKRQIYYLDNVK